MKQVHIPTKKQFFTYIARQHLSITYDDVLLVPGYSEVLPKEVSVTTRFSRNVPLNIPIVSAAMDTVTEARMAIAMAQNGGLGIIHKNLKLKERAAHTAKVKFYRNARIRTPITVHENERIEAILKKRDEKDWQFHTFPVIDNDGRLKGVLTETDFEFCKDVSLPASEVMTTEVVTAQENTLVDAAYALMTERKKKMLPIVDANNRVVGLYVFSDVMRIISGRSAINNIDANGQLRVGVAIGVGKTALEEAELLRSKHADVVVVDTAHGHSKKVLETVRAVKDAFPDLDVVAGNVSTGEATLALIKAGADGIKVGQGPGSICTTRVVSGAGSPQLSAIYNCVRAAAGSGVPVCADGGIVYSGDITKAIGAGADSVMLGSLLAGIDESPGKIVWKDGQKWKEYRGMGSLGAMEDRQGAGSRERYGQKDVPRDKLVPEGVEALVPYKGLLAEVITQYVGGLCSGMGYVGAATIPELQTKARFTRPTKKGKVESHPHGVVITKEAPNYQRRGK